MSRNKTILLISAMLAWMLAVAALIYLFPVIADTIAHSDTTATWLKTLHRSGYYPTWAAIVGVIMAALGTGITLVGQLHIPTKQSS